MHISLNFLHKRYAQSTFMLLAFALMAGIVPVTAQEEVNRFAQEGRLWLSFDDRVATTTDSVVVPANRETGTPEYLDVTFDRWIDGSLTDTSDFIRVYRVADFNSTDYSRYVLALDFLDEVMAERPTPPTNTIYGDFVRYMDFQNGSGVAYRGGNGETLTYQFQGVTDDRRYYISTQFILGAEVGLPFETADEFTNTIRMLDELYASMKIDLPEMLVESSSAAAMTAVEFENIAFEVASELAWRVEGDVIPPVVDLEGVSMWGSQPGATAFSFPGFPDQNTIHDAELRVITVAATPENADTYFEYVAELQALLAERPDFASDLNPSDGGTPDGPNAVLLGGAERIMARPQYIDFEGGTGVRYLTYFSQGAATMVENDEVYYVFEGMTDDGAYTVSATFPLYTDFPETVPTLDPNTYYPSGDPAYAEYLTQVVSGLDAQAASDFTPNLDALDAIIRSLRVE